MKNIYKAILFIQNNKAIRKHVTYYFTFAEAYDKCQKCLRDYGNENSFEGLLACYVARNESGKWLYCYELPTGFEGFASKQGVQDFDEIKAIADKRKLPFVSPRKIGSPQRLLKY